MLSLTRTGRVTTVSSTLPVSLIHYLQDKRHHPFLLAKTRRFVLFCFDELHVESHDIDTSSAAVGKGFILQTIFPKQKSASAERPPFATLQTAYKESDLSTM